MIAELIHTIFKKDHLHDGSKREALDIVKSAREDLQQATSNLNDTIKNLLDENDNITRRQRRNVKPPKQ